MTDREREVRHLCDVVRCNDKSTEPALRLATALLAVLDAMPYDGQGRASTMAIHQASFRSYIVDAAHAALFHSGAKDENE